MPHRVGQLADERPQQDDHDVRVGYRAGPARRQENPAVGVLPRARQVGTVAGNGDPDARHRQTTAHAPRRRVRVRRASPGVGGGPFLLSHAP